MSLATGTRLGPYEILSPLGAGGMGEVYRARDTKLNRDVALKVLPESFASDPDRLARFQREAQVLASLNHPNIAHIHGLEESGGVRALVMELVEGEDLAQRLTRGAIPVDEALPIAKQIAEALEAAHEQGIIHRDLKPANIKVRPDGTVKVLDFGLAKAMDPRASAPEVSQSPTITSPAMTRAGMILGTAAYMSPEQARGKSVDKRSDIWAFGCVLYEMLTGKQAFATGGTVSDAIAAVLTREPQFASLPPGTPPAIHRVLKRALEKDPRERLHDIADARLELQEARSGGGAPIHQTPSTGWKTLLRVAAATALVTSIAAGAFTWAMLRGRATSTSEHGATRFAVTLPKDRLLMGVSPLDLSPDGRKLVYTANNMLYLQRLDQIEATAIAGSEGNNESPVFSPDGQWIAYSSRDALKKIRITGGNATKICDVVALTGLRWVGDQLIFSARNPADRSSAFIATSLMPTGIFEVSASGGTPRQLVPATATEQLQNPDLLPDGDTLLFTARTFAGAFSIVAQSMRTGKRHVVVTDARVGRVLASGDLLIARGATLYVQPFNAATLDVTGGPTAVVTNLMRPNVFSYTESVGFAVSATGSLAYVTALPEARRLVWVDRDGREQPLGADPMPYIYPVISPDGQQVALNVHDENYSIWTWNIATSALSRVTLDDQDARHPVWSADGKSVFYTVGGTGGRRLMRRSADGAGAPEAVTSDVTNKYALTASPDGKSFVYREGPNDRYKLVLVRLDGERQPRPLIERADASLLNASISFDGRWIAYAATESEQVRVYVQPFPNVNDGRWLVSPRGGDKPVWARDGRALYFLTPDRAHMAMVPITPGPAFNFGPAVDAFDVRRFVTAFSGRGDAGRPFDISPDGKRFLMLTPANDTPQQLVVVERWLDELKARTVN